VLPAGADGAAEDAARVRRIVRGIRQTRPWGMIEVFMIGVLVTVVKLSTMAQVLPGVALWSFGALVVVLAAMLSFDPRDLWHYLEPPDGDDTPPGAQEPAP
jgi:paraquat-inducible protein A